jgi:hypothetical protein
MILKNAAAADGQEDNTDFAAASIGFYMRVAALPDATSHVFQFINNASAIQAYIALTSGGLLAVGQASGAPAATGTSVIALDTWYLVEAIYDDVADTLSVKLDGTAEPNLTGVTVASGGVNGSLFGSSEAGGIPSTVGFDINFDDVVIETDNTLANIDFPGANDVARLLPAATATDDDWLLGAGSDKVDAVTNDDQNSGFIISLGAASEQTFTLASSASSGITGTIKAVELAVSVRRDTTISALTTRLRQGANVDDSGSSSPGTSFNGRLKIYEQDLTATDWTTAALDVLEAGVTHSSVVTNRCTVVVLQVAFAPGGGMANSTYLDQVANLTGPLKEVTSYTPAAKTVKITSESVGVPNQAINVVAVSVKHVPWGRGTIRGVWNVDKLDTNSFTVSTNPLSYDNMGTSAAVSSFIFNTSTMLDGDQVYTDWIELGCSGKVFELELTQTGNLCWDILGLNVEVRVEGERPAYISGDF